MKDKGICQQDWRMLFSRRYGMLLAELLIGGTERGQSAEYIDL